MNIFLPSYISDEINAGALFVINHSGGKDSQAMMIKMLQVIPVEQLLVVHASLGEMEWPGALELAEKQAADAGIPFIVARARKSLLEMVGRRFSNKPEVPSWPSAKNRQCTSDLKRDPITREVRHFIKTRGITRVVNCMGLRAQESSARAKKVIWKPHRENGRAGRTWYEFLPIHSLTTDEVVQTISDAGQQMHYAYEKNDRLSCVFCIMANKQDLIHGAMRNPELYNVYCAYEVLTGYAMHSSMKTLPELTGIKPSYIPVLELTGETGGAA